MLFLSQGGQAQKWYNQYGNVSCDAACQLFNQLTNQKKKIKKSKNEVVPSPPAL